MRSSRIALAIAALMLGGFAAAAPASAIPPRGADDIATPPRHPKPNKWEGCWYGNDNIIRCPFSIWSCDEDGVCIEIEIETTCYSKYGDEVVPCPEEGG
jgi:hypothetical protein